MIILDEDLLMCDFAETYHIYDIYSLDVNYAATLAMGLRDDSRIRLKANGLEVDSKTLLLARICDNTALNCYMKTEDAIKGVNRPKSVVEALVKKKDNDEIQSFECGADFEKEWRRLNGN